MDGGEWPQSAVLCCQSKHIRTGHWSKLREPPSPKGSQDFKKKIPRFFPDEFSKFRDNYFYLFPVSDKIWCYCREHADVQCQHAPQPIIQCTHCLDKKPNTTDCPLSLLGQSNFRFSPDLKHFSQIPWRFFHDCKKGNSISRFPLFRG